MIFFMWKKIFQNIGRPVISYLYFHQLDTTSKSMEARWNAFDAIDGLDEYSHCWVREYLVTKISIVLGDVSSKSVPWIRMT